MRVNGDDKVVNVLQYMAADMKAIIEKMVALAGMNGESTVDQLLDKYPISEVTREERIALLSLAFTNDNKFAPKLDFKRRCEILALVRLGITRDVIAEIYAVDRRTVTHIANPISPHYKTVKREWDRLGAAKFQELYLEEETLNRALAYRATKQKIKPVNNMYANGKMGIHNVRGPMCSYDHRVAIGWREVDEKIHIAGWYYRDLDGDNPDDWFCCNDESLKTSAACYAAMIDDITDKMLGSAP
jgi:hypothetical protein